MLRHGNQEIFLGLLIVAKKPTRAPKSTGTAGTWQLIQCEPIDDISIE